MSSSAKDSHALKTTQPSTGASGTGANINYKTVILGILVILGSFLYKSFELRYRVLGMNRKVTSLHGEELRVIPDTVHMEDLHYHEPSGLLFGASEENADCHWRWWPPIAILDDTSCACQGAIVTIDPKTFKSTRLTFTNFSNPFITHGIDTWSPPSDPSSVYIFAVNHLTNPDLTSTSPKSVPRARSQIELFHHKIGTSSVSYLRSILHPLITTPNDIYMVSNSEFYVTNDHHYRDGFRRLFEVIGFQSLAPWTTTIHVSLSNLNTLNATADLAATIALSGLHNNNGLGHGPKPEDVVIGRAAAGALVFARRSATTPPDLEVLETVQLDSAIDNPSYFQDPYAKETGRDASGYVIAGLARAADWPKGPNPCFVWMVRPAAEEAEAAERPEAAQRTEGRYEKKLIFADDHNTIDSASTAVIVAINPEENGGKKQGWLFVTGPVSLNVIATKIDL